MDIDFLSANAESIADLCDRLRSMVTLVFPPSWNPKVSFTVEDNPVRKILAGEYEFRITVKVPKDSIDAEMARRGDATDAKK